MAHNTMQKTHKKKYMLSFLTFFLLFILFVYGALFIALLGIADWIIHSQNLQFFIERGNGGILSFAFLILISWVSCAVITATLAYYGLQIFVPKKQAQKISTIVLFAFFHIFATPCILWPSLRDNIPALKKRHKQKLKQIAKRNSLQQKQA